MCALAVYAICGLNLIGWKLQNTFLTRVHTRLFPMMPSTAMALLLCAMSILLLQSENSRPAKIIGRILSLIVLIIAFASFNNYLTMMNAGLDRLLLSPENFPISYLKPPFPSLLNFVLVAAALLSTDLKTWKGICPAQAFALAGAVISISSICTFLYESWVFNSQFIVSPIPNMSVLAAACFGLLSLSIILLRSDRGIMTLLISPTSGGIMARRLIFGLLLAPFLVGLLALLGKFGEVNGYTMKYSLSVVTTFATLAILTWYTARQLEKHDEARMRTEKALAAAEQKFRGLLESAPDGVIIIQDDGFIDFANSEALRMLGYLKGELVDKPVEILLPERFKSVLAPHALQFLDSPGHMVAPLGTQLYGLRKDKTEFPVDVAVSPMINDSETYFTISVRDVTERLKILEQQKFLAEVTRTLAESLDYETTLQKVARLAVPRVSDWCVLYTCEEGVKPSAIACADPDLHATLEELLSNYLSPADSEHGAARALRDGKVQFVPFVSPEMLRTFARDERHREILEKLAVKSSIMVPMRAQGKILGVLNFANVTAGRYFTNDDLHLAEEVASRAGMAIDNARLYKETQKAVRTREEILAIVSHDLKNPLAAIQLNANLLTRKASTSQAAADLIGPTARGILNASARINRLIQDLLDFAAIASGHLTVNAKENDLRMILLEALENFRLLTRQKGISIVSEIPGPLPPVNCDKYRTLQILTNLLDNALKFTPVLGLITVRARAIENEVRVEISDTGPGINPADLPHLFKRYWQAKETARLGHGMGLSIAKGLMEAQGATILVESKLGQGTVFTLVFPVRAETGDLAGNLTETTTPA